jgi:uncharacterized coiled-coil DUF342 family protein
MAHWAKQRADEQAVIAAAKTQELKSELRKKADAIKQLQRLLDEEARKAGNFWYQLGQLFGAGPFWPWEWDNWHRQADKLRGSLEDLEDHIRKTAEQMDEAHEKMMRLK